MHALLPFVSIPGMDARKLSEFLAWAEHVAVAQALCYRLTAFLPSTVAIATISCAIQLAGIEKSPDLVPQLCALVDEEQSNVAACLAMLEEHIRDNLVMTGPMKASNTARAKTASPTSVKAAAHALHAPLPTSTAQTCARHAAIVRPAPLVAGLRGELEPEPEHLV